jgi:hypothetical protein
MSAYQDVIAAESYLSITRRRQSIGDHPSRRHLRRARAALNALVVKFTGESESDQDTGAVRGEPFGVKPTSFLKFWAVATSRTSSRAPLKPLSRRVMSVRG